MKMDPVTLGFLLVFLGFILIIIGSANQNDANSKFFVGGILGFIPFGFGNDKSMVKFGLIITIALFILFLLLSRSVGGS